MNRRPPRRFFDAGRVIVMPSLVDTHRHMWQGILRNVLPDGSLEDYRDVVQRTFGAKRGTRGPSYLGGGTSPAGGAAPAVQVL
jgi:predicted amidohydrolase YtcJ